MFNAFISYSHSADDQFAPSLQEALQKFAKPWYKKRYLEIFRDESSLSASPHLWNNITKALDQSEYVILLASPASEKSKWVNKEIEYWLEHKSIDNILIALTDGSMDWDDASNGFLHADNNSLPPALDNKFDSAPFYIDLRQSRTAEDLSLDNPIFKKEVLKLAAKLHGRAPNDLASEEVTVHRRMIMLRNSAIAVLVFLLISALGAAFFANEKTKEAVRERNTAQANFLRSEGKSILESDPTIALRLYEQALLLHKDSTIEKEEYVIFSKYLFYKIAAIDSSGISAAVFSPDGKTIFTGSYDGTARLWDLKGRTVLDLNKYSIDALSDDHKINSPSDDIPSLAFSPDGKSMLIAFSFGSVSRLMDLKGRTLQEFRVHDHITSVAFAPDGKTIITGCRDGTTQLWGIDGKMIREYKGHNGVRELGNAILSLAYSPDSKTFLTGSRDATARLWDLHGNPILEYKGHTAEIVSVAFSRDGKMIFTGSKDGSVRIWDVPILLNDFLKSDEIEKLSIAQKRNYGIIQTTGQAN